MAGNVVAWFEIYVQDMVRAKRFYEEVFQLRLRTLDTPVPNLEMFSFPDGVMDRYGATGALVKMAGMPSGGNSTIVYFHCENCSEEESRVVQNGGHIHKAKMSICPYGFISLLVDTEGNMIGLHSMA